MAGFLLFFGAALADLVDAGLHLWISHMITVSHSCMQYSNVEVLEGWSSECIGLSAACMVVGEVATFRFHQLKNNVIMQHQEATRSMKRRQQQPGLHGSPSI